MSQVPTSVPMQTTTPLANTPAALTPPVDAGAVAGGGQSWGDILKGVVGNPNFMPMIMMASMMAGSKGKNKMSPLLLAMMMGRNFLPGQGAGAAPSAPGALPPTGTATA